MTDIVYVLGSGSTWQDNEIRYSLRSIEKHLKNFNRVFIIGQCPQFLKCVIHIPMADLHRQNRERNIFEKILRAAGSAQISHDFIFFNDDHFLLQDFDAGTFPVYYNMPLIDQIKKRKKHDGYRISLSNTLMVLEREKLPALNYDVHCPILYNKNRFLQFAPRFNWNVHYGYVIKSLYCNSHSIPGQQIDDCKIDYRLTVEEIHARIDHRPFFSIGDKGLTDQMKAIISMLYPQKSQWER